MHRLLVIASGSLAIVVAFGCSSGADGGAAPSAAGSASVGNGGSAGAGGSATSGAGTASSSGASSSGASNNGGSAGSGAGGLGGSSVGGSSASGGGGVAGTGTPTGGGGGTGGSGGGGATDGSFCGARAGLSFCEDFEKHAAGSAQATGPWSPSVNGDGTVEIDTTTAHSGKSSLKVHGSGFSTFYVLNAGSLLSPPTSPLYLRAYVKLTEAMTGGHNTFVVADLAASPGAGNAFRLGEMNAMLMYTVSGDTHGALANEKYYTDHLPGAALSAGTWGCLEITLDHAKPEIAVALDGTPIADLHHTDFPLDTYDTLRFGFEKYAGPVADVWYDDIAIGTAPLGCH